MTPGQSSSSQPVPSSTSSSTPSTGTRRAFEGGDDEQVKTIQCLPSSTGTARPTSDEADGERATKYTCLPTAGGYTRTSSLVAVIGHSNPGVVGTHALSSGQDIDIVVNEAPAYVRGRLTDPAIFEMSTHFRICTSTGMNTEMERLQKFEVKEAAPVEDLTSDEIENAMDFTWLIDGKCFIRSRRCVRGFTQTIMDLDDTCASTPLAWNRYILLAVVLSVGWPILLCDISAAFLHADLSTEDPLYVWPPTAFYPDRKIWWRLRKAMHGLRTAPNEWQHSCSTTMERLGYRRLQSDPNAYVHRRRAQFIVVYVCDLMLLAAPQA